MADGPSATAAADQAAAAARTGGNDGRGHRGDGIPLAPVNPSFAGSGVTRDSDRATSGGSKSSRAGSERSDCMISPSPHRGCRRDRQPGRAAHHQGGRWRRQLPDPDQDELQSQLVFLETEIYFTRINRTKLTVLTGRPCLLPPQSSRESSFLL